MVEAAPIASGARGARKARKTLGPIQKPGFFKKPGFSAANSGFNGAAFIP